MKVKVAVDFRFKREGNTASMEVPTGEIAYKINISSIAISFIESDLVIKVQGQPHNNRPQGREYFYQGLNRNSLEEIRQSFIHKNPDYELLVSKKGKSDFGSECDGYVIQTKNFRFTPQDSAESEARGRAVVLSDFLEAVKEKLNLSSKIEQRFVNFFSEFGYEVPLLSEERLPSESPRSSVASSSSANLRFLSPQQKEKPRDAQRLEVAEENCPKS